MISIVNYLMEISPAFLVSAPHNTKETEEKLNQRYNKPFKLEDPDKPLQINKNKK